MKKSIFLFFAAILCATSANAQLYLRGGFNDWGTTHKFVDNVCEIELAGATTYEFKIADSNWSTQFGTGEFTATATKTLTSSGGNMKITTTIPGTYKFEFVESTKTLTVTYPAVPAPHDITVRAKLPATWTSSTITAWVWTSEDASGTSVTAEKDGDYYKITKKAGALYMIFRNGEDWNGDKNQTVDLVYTEDVCLQLNQSGDAKATATVIDCGAVAKDITIKAVVPGAWEETITAWVWPTGGEGEEVTPIKEGNWYVITKNCIELNVIFKNGTGWNGNENQTVNIQGVTENTCYQISALNKVDGKCSVTEVDCDAVIEPEAKPEPTPTYDYYIAGTLPGAEWNASSLGMELVEGKTDVYEATFDLAANAEYDFKITDGQWNSESDKSHEHTTLAAVYVGVTGGNGNIIKVNLAEAKELTITFNSTEDKIYFNLDEETASLTYRVQVPEETEACYIAGPCNNWAFREMTREGTTNIFTIDIVGAKETDAYKYACQADWAYAEVIDGGGNRTNWTALDEVTEWGKPADPAEVKCYLMGNGDWVNGVEMTLNPNNNNEYMLLDHYISAPFKFKLGDEWSDQVDNYDFPGIAWADDNIILPDGYYDFYFKKDSKKVYIANTTDTYTRDVTNKFGTICLPYTSVSTTGATFYEVCGKETGKVYLVSVTKLDAGMPYIFEATASPSQIKVVYNKNTKVATAGVNNGLKGTFEDETVVPANNYILYNNAFIPADGTTNKVNAYRAYLNMDAVQGGKPTQTMPGRRYIGMSVQGENETTGVEDLFTTDAPVKVIENGQFIIIRDGVKYNVQGQKL